MNVSFSSLQPLTFVSILFLVCSLTWACKEQPSITPIGEAEIVLIQPDQPSLTFDQIDADVTTDAETNPFVHATLTATQSSGDATLVLKLNDDDETVDPFVPGTDFAINTGTSSISASLIFTDNNTTFTAVSGKVSVNVYECMPEQEIGTLDVLRLSGNFTVSDGATEITGTFTDIRVTCIECEGGC